MGKPAESQRRESKMESQSNNSRREFLKTSGVVTAGAVAASMMSLPKAHAEGTDEIKVAIIGAGGRGSGAAVDCVKAGGNVKIWAIADAFEDRAKGAVANITKECKEKA